MQFSGTYDPTADTLTSGGLGPLRPYNGNPNAPKGTIAFSYEAACNFQAVTIGFNCCSLLIPDTNIPVNPNGAVQGQFIIFNTLQPGSIGTVVPNIQAALQQARLIYNDSGFTAFGLPNFNFNNATAFQYFRTPYGNVGRNTFFGDGFYTVNLSMLKSFKISERMQLEFRAEADNLFNRRNFGVPDAFTEDAFFGNFVGSFQNPGFNFGDARELRLGVRFLF